MAMTGLVRTTLPLIGGITDIIYLIGLLVVIVEESVVFTVPFNDWNKSDNKVEWEKKQYACHHGNHTQAVS